MKKTPISKGIDFADASYRSLEMAIENHQNNLIVYCQSWQEKTIKLTFFNTLGFVYSLGDIISEVYENDERDCFFHDLMKKEYSEVPSNLPFKTYIIEDINDSPIFQIVAENVEIVLY